MATISEAARHIDLDERRFRELVDAGTITRAPRGAYEIDRVRTEYIRSLREVAAGRARTGELDPQQEKARKDKEYADHLAMRNAVARGDQVLVEDVVKALTDELAIIRSRLLAIPGKLGGRLKPDDRQAIETEIYEALSELSSVDSPDQVKDYATGRKPNQGRMGK